MKKLVFLICLASFTFTSQATIHIIRVWNGYFQFVPISVPTVQLGDTIQWLPLDAPTMTHTVTSDSIPAGAATFDQIWRLPADTFFQYVPQVVGYYRYVCTPHAPGMSGTFIVSAATTIDENASIDDKHVVYPNPTDDIITISNLKSDVQYRVLDIGGKAVKTGKTGNTIDVSELKAGIYYIELLGEKREFLKMVKL